MVVPDQKVRGESQELVVLMVLQDVPDVQDLLDLLEPLVLWDLSPRKVLVVNLVLLATPDSLVHPETEDLRDFKENKESLVFLDPLDHLDLKDIQENVELRERLEPSVLPEILDLMDQPDKMVSLVFEELVVSKDLLVSPVNLAQLVAQDFKDHPDLLEPPVRSVFLAKLDPRVLAERQEVLDAMETMAHKDSLVFLDKRELVARTVVLALLDL